MSKCIVSSTLDQGLVWAYISKRMKTIHCVVVDLSVRTTLLIQVTSTTSCDDWNYSASRRKEIATEGNKDSVRKERGVKYNDSQR